jgi:hypothetical protein
MPTELDHLQQILSTTNSLEGWRTRSRELETPIRDSQLYQDDEIWKWLPISEITRQSLIASTQHLNLALTAIKARDIYPISHFTVLRGGLIGACQAVWILGPDDHNERQQRGLRVIHEWYKQALKYSETQVNPKQSPHTSDPEIDHMRLRKVQCRELWRQTQTLTEKQELNLTDTIKWAGKFVLRDPTETQQIELLWRAFSGDAHALGWSLLTRNRSLDRHEGDGMGVFLVGGDLESLTEAFKITYRMLKRGWSLFDQRCESI